MFLFTNVGVVAVDMDTNYYCNYRRSITMYLINKLHYYLISKYILVRSSWFPNYFFQERITSLFQSAQARAEAMYDAYAIPSC